MTLAAFLNFVKRGEFSSAISALSAGVFDKNDRDDSGNTIMHHVINYILQLIVENNKKVHKKKDGKYFLKEEPLLLLQKLIEDEYPFNLANNEKASPLDLFRNYTLFACFANHLYINAYLKTNIS